jgi:hypothetical protein
MRKLASRLPVGVRIAAVLGVIAALIVAAAASGAAKPSKCNGVKVSNLELSFCGGFSPTVLPKKTMAPIAFSLSANFKSLDGSHLPALKEFLIETDKNGGLNTVGYPVCSAAKIQSTNSDHALQACGPALIGKGKTTVGIELSEDQPEIDAHSDLLLFNGGVRGGVTTLLVHAYLTLPVPAAVVTTVKVTKVHHGRYGTLAVASIPKIAGGSGSVKSFNLKVDKKFTYKGKKFSVLSAKCPDGKLQGKGKAVFVNYKTGESTTASAEVLRTCTGKG